MTGKIVAAAEQCLSDPAWLAAHATGPHSFYRGEHSVPGITWVNDFPGQVTDGRIGRPEVCRVPLSWLPLVLGEAVKAIIRAERGENV